MLKHCGRQRRHTGAIAAAGTRTGIRDHLGQDGSGGGGRPGLPAQDALRPAPALPGQRRIAQYLIEHITEAAFLSITDLAERVGVSQPSVTRFAAAVGFSGYPALREKLQSIALGTLAGGPAATEENGSNELQAAVDAEIENLENLRRDFADPDQLIAIGRRLAASTP